MSNNVAIKVENVSKTFKLPHEKNNSIKAAVVNFYRRKKSFEEQKVLSNISLEIEKGEFFGIVGRNGSGKSTLLKILAEIYSPSEGRVEINGKLTPFIELGVGFNPELTGRENVFLNGALLGFNRAEMNVMYDEIVRFAELEKFMDQKLKNYSSGMQVRLAFSIAIRAESDMLVLDEVLAVGDAAFQKKCNAVFADYRKRGKTVVLVSHDMEAVKKFCSKVAVIHKGTIQGVYSANEAAAVYQELNSPQQETSGSKTVRRWGDGEVKIRNVTIRNPDGKSIRCGDALEVNIKLEAKQNLPVTLGLMFEDNEGVNISGPNSGGEKIFTGENAIYRIDKLPLQEGDYKITVAVFSEDLSKEHDHIYNGFDLKVSGGTTTSSRAGKIEFFGHWRKDTR